MAKVKDSKIVRVLQRIVREAVAKDQEVTPKQVKLQAERELDLDAGFLNEGEWKSRSREIIQEAFNEDEEVNQTKGPTKAPSPSKPTKTTVAATKDVAEQSRKHLKKNKEDSTQQKVTASAKAKKTSLPNGHASKKAENTHDSDGSTNADSTESSDVDSKVVAQPPAIQKPDRVPSPVNGVKRKASQEDSSTDSSDSDRESEDLPEVPAKKKARSNSRESTQTLRKASKAVPPTQASTDQGQQSSVEAIPAPQYRPPPGFSPVKPSALDSNDTLSPTHLDGKQIWHIIAPSTIPPSSLSNLTLDSLNSTHPETTINNLNYVIDTDTFSSTHPATIMLPTPEDYKAVPQKVSRTLTLKQKIDLPNLNARQASQMTGSSAAADVAQPAVSNIRPQPKGLRMRYRPPGFGPGKLGAVGSGSESAGEEDEGEQTAFQFPKALGGHGPAKRKTRESDVSMVDAEVEAPARKEKKKKKKRKEKHARESQAQDDGAVARDTSLTPPSKVRHLVPDRSNPSDLKPTKFLSNGVSHEEASEDDEKAKRREKRLRKERKEAKRRAKEASQTA